MSVSRARKLVMCGDAVMIALIALLVYLMVTLPGQEVDIVPDAAPGAPGHDEQGGPGVTQDKFVAGLESDRPPAEERISDGKDGQPRNAAASWEARMKASLKLKGTYVADDDAESIAVLQWLTSGEELYHIGEMIEGPESATLTRVETEYVEVSKDANTLRIDMTASTGSPGRPTPLRRTAPPPVPPAQPKQIAPHKYVVPKGSIKPYFDRPEKLWTEVGIKPEMRNDEPTGAYVITSMKPDSLLRKLGLRVGDTIGRINGQSPNNLMTVISDPALKDLHIDFKRAGRNQSLHCAITE